MYFMKWGFVDVTLFFERLGIMFMFIQLLVVLDSLHYD